MNATLVGSWLSKASTISGYECGRERLQLRADGEHVWRVDQRVATAKPSIIRFTLIGDGPEYQLRPFDSVSGRPKAGWQIIVKVLSSEQIAVTAQHGFTTIFEREREPSP